MPLYSPQAERALLGACLIDPEAIFLLDGLEPDHFRGGGKGQDHATLFRAMQAVVEHGQRLDVVTLSDELAQRGWLERAGGNGYLVELISHTPTSTHVESYAAEVMAFAVRRRLTRVLADCLALVRDHSIEGPVAEVQARIGHLMDAGSEDELLASDDLLNRYLELYAEREAGELDGLTTGYHDLDRMLALRKHDYVVVGGRPSMGKTAFVESLAEHVAGQGHSVLFMSIEMDPLLGLTERRVSRWAGLPKQDLERARVGLQEITTIVGQRAGAPLAYLRTRIPTVGRLRAHLKRLEARGELPRLVVIDYLQLMHAPGDNDYQRVSRVSLELVGIKREFPITLLVVSQLSRAVESRHDKRPLLSDLRESGLIEQDADVVMFIYRDEVYNQSTGRVGIAEVSVAKQRNGPTGRIELAFVGETMRFVNLLGG